MTIHDTTADTRVLTLRGWTGEYLQARELEDGDFRLWHPDGSYCGRLVPGGPQEGDTPSGTVYGPTGLYLADAQDGRLHVDLRRRRARATAQGIPANELASPGELPAVERRWPRRSGPLVRP
ncbi:MAG TPA: hypothetical protein VGF46_10665 [Gaiellales bacterium]